MSKNIIIAVLAILFIGSLAYSFQQSTRAEVAEERVEQLKANITLAEKKAIEIQMMARAQAEKAHKEAEQYRILAAHCNKDSKNE